VTTAVSHDGGVAAPAQYAKTLLRPTRSSFSGPPLIITGGTGSPINPMVFK